MELLDISDVTKRSGFAASTLRYYEERGLIQSLGRKGLRRQYEPQVLERLALIAMGQSAGFSLDEIAGIFDGDAGFTIDRDMLRDQARKLREQIKHLTLLSDILDHTANCSAPNHSQCPNFRRIMDAALRVPKSTRGRGGLSSQ